MVIVNKHFAEDGVYLVTTSAHEEWMTDAYFIIQAVATETGPVRWDFRVAVRNPLLIENEL
jgi:hypothetical protein